MFSKIFHPLLCVALLATTSAEFSPNLTISSCTSSRVVIHLEGAVEGGLLFIQGGGNKCVKTTAQGQNEHTFEFDTCKIKYDSKFRVVVQKNPRYQTGTDKVIPVMCQVDTSDLFVTGIIFPEEDIDAAMNKTVKPTVRMRITSGSKGSETGPVSEVSINEKLKMSLELAEEYLHDFDIKAKDCIASRLPLVENECSSDKELFPNFEKQQRGALLAAFQAFTPTNLVGQAEVDVAFTCNVTVCRGECHQKVCGEIVGWGRKKRGNDDEYDDVYEKLTIGTTIKVKTNNPDGHAHNLNGDEDVLCGSKVMVTVVLAIAVFTVIISWIVCGCVTAKLRRAYKTSGDDTSKERPSALRRLSEHSINFARSVGRRMSNILNLPVGYNKGDHKMIESIPDCMEDTPPPTRRDLVTVTRVAYVDQ